MPNSKGVKGANGMIAISKEEAMAIREKYGSDVHIAITNRHKRGGRKHYFVEETSRVTYFLDRFRKQQVKRGARSD